MRIRSTFIATFVISALAVGVQPASAGTPTTDLMVARYDTDTQMPVGTVGNNIYTNDPTTQRKTLRTKAGSTAHFLIMLQNDGDNGSFSCAFLSDPPKPGAITIYDDDYTTDTTDEWDGAGFDPTIVAGAHDEYHFKMKVPGKAKRGTTFTYLFGCTSSISITQDTVSAVVKVRG